MPPPRTLRHRLSALYELQPGGDDRLLSMEGLRGLAMAMVFLVHYTTLAAPWLAEAGPVSRMAAKAILHIGPAGVDLFFAISGYLIYGSLIARPQPFGRRLDGELGGPVHAAEGRNVGADHRAEHAHHDDLHHRPLAAQHVGDHRKLDGPGKHGAFQHRAQKQEGQRPAAARSAVKLVLGAAHLAAVAVRSGSV